MWVGVYLVVEARERCLDIFNHCVFYFLRHPFTESGTH